MTAPLGTPLGWQRVRDLFHSTLERDPAARADYLDQACAGDADLRREVDSLIAAHGQVGSFIAEPVGTPDHPQTTLPRPSLPAGFQIGPYELIELLGAGGMGVVYRAHDPRLGRDVALKVLPSDLASNPERRERFLREARMVSALNHPNICTIHEIGRADGLDYICFEYIEGPTLAAVLEGPVLPFERVLELAIPLSEALAYAHGKGILHRDLKPSNIMISARGPKILDFGLAKSLALPVPAPGSTTSLSDVGLVMGTAAYMSPEQALGRQVDERSDIFSFGAVLYELASGKQAFLGNTPTEVIDAVLHRDPTPLGQVRSELPVGLSLVVNKALRKDAGGRYQSMADLAADLRRIEAGRGALIAGRRRRLIRAAIVATMVSSLAIGFLLRDRWRAAPPAPLPNSLAVMHFENLSDRTDADSLGRMLTGLVTTDLATSDGLQVVSSQRLFDIARQLGKAEGTSDRSVATDVARRAGASKMVLGQVAHAGSRTVVTAELVEVAGGRLLGSYRVEGRSSDDVFAMAEGLGGQVRAYLTGRPGETAKSGSLTRQLTASTEAYRAYVRGEALLHRFETEKAEEELRRAVQIDPEFALAHYRLSIAAHMFSWGANQESRSAAERAVALKAKLSAQDRDLVEGNLLYVQGRISEAVLFLESAHLRDPDHKELLYLLSEVYTHSPQHCDLRHAAELMERILALDPEFHLIYYHLALNYAYIGEFGKARERLDSWEAQEPDLVLDIRGMVSALEGRLDEALRLTELPNDRLNSIFFRSILGLAAGRWDIVQGLLRKHGSSGDLVPALRSVRADLHVYLGELDRAEAAFREALPARLEEDEGQLGGRIIRAFHAVAGLLVLKGDLKAAQREAERALAVQPLGPYSLYVAGWFAVRAGDIPAAERHLRTLEEVAKSARSPRVPHYRGALVAELALARGRPSEALPLLEEAVSVPLFYDAWIFSPGPFFRDSLARTYVALGEKQKAADMLEALVASGMERVTQPLLYVRALYTLGNLRLDLGDRARGRQRLQEFLTHWGKADWDLPEVRNARARLASTT